MRRARCRATLALDAVCEPNEEDEMGELLELTREGLRRNDANDLDGFIAMQAADCEWVTPDGILKGRDAVRDYVGRFRRAFPDGRHTIVRAVEGEDEIAVEGRWEGTHTGPFAVPEGDVPPTGRTVTIPFALFVAGDPNVGEAARVAIYMDNMAIAAQLGLLPEPATA
jgi:predicted ester cyclase